MSKYLTMILRLESDQTPAATLMQQVELFQGVKLAAAGWSHAFDERDDLRRALENVLRSATPHPTEHPTMHEAWKQGQSALAKVGYPIPDQCLN